MACAGRHCLMIARNNRVDGRRHSYCRAQRGTCSPFASALYQLLRCIFSWLLSAPARCRVAALARRLSAPAAALLRRYGCGAAAAPLRYFDACTPKAFSLVPKLPNASNAMASSAPVCVIPAVRCRLIRMATSAIENPAPVDVADSTTPLS